ITERKRAQEQERRYFHDLAFLSQMAMEYVDLPQDVDIHEFLGEKVNSLVGDGYTLVLSYDRKEDMVEVRAAFGIDHRMRKAVRMLGRDLVGLRFPVRDEFRPSTAGPRLRRIDMPLADLVGDVIPRAVLAPLEKILGVRAIYEMWLVSRGEILGALVILTRRRELRNRELIEALLNQASVAIQRKMAIDALVENEKKYSTVVEQGNDAIIIIVDGVVKFMNARAKELAGLREEETYDHMFLDFVAPEYRKMLVDRYARRIRGEDVPTQYEIEVIVADGTRIPVEVSVSTIDYMGDLAIMAIIRDVSERKAAERAIRESEEKYRTLVERSHDGVYIHQDGRFTFVNERVIDITGYSREELMGMGLADILHPEDRDIVMQFSDDREHGRNVPHTFQARLITKDGKVRYGEFSVSRITLKGRSGELGAIRDITLRRQVEEELKEHAKALERSNRELEQFAYVASHDLQEPLRMVASYVQLLERRYKGKLDEDADEFIAYAVDGAKRMQGLINDLLQYSRVHTRGRPFEPTDLEEVLQRTLDNLKIAIEESGAVITHDPLPTVMVDGNQLVLLLQNLIGNAIKF
ncbi:MAG TPA: PAS domain S-box protein, partial [Thermoplasmata archaeon]|nr:PAS domain S-box protein [Thermoplasmata archaeon]